VNIDLGTLAGSGSSTANGINDAGPVAECSDTASGLHDAFVSSAGIMNGSSMNLLSSLG